MRCESYVIASTPGLPSDAPCHHRTTQALPQNAPRTHSSIGSLACVSVSRALCSHVFFRFSSCFGLPNMIQLYSSGVCLSYGGFDLLPVGRDCVAKSADCASLAIDHNRYLRMHAPVNLIDHRQNECMLHSPRVILGLKLWLHILSIY